MKIPAIRKNIPKSVNVGVGRDGHGKCSSIVAYDDNYSGKFEGIDSGFGWKIDFLHQNHIFAVFFPQNIAMPSFKPSKFITVVVIIGHTT